MTSRTTISESRAQRQVSVNVADPVTGQRSLALGPQKLALKKLATAADGPKGIARDNE
jgi:hypothetical protein